MSKGDNIVKWIKGQRISLLGYLERMEEDRMPKNIFTQELEGTKRRWRPRKGWREEVERDLQVLGVRRWRELVTGQNGGTWFDRPKPTTGCSANGRRRRRRCQEWLEASFELLKSRIHHHQFWTAWEHGVVIWQRFVWVVYLCSELTREPVTQHRIPDSANHLKRVVYVVHLRLDSYGGQTNVCWPFKRWINSHLLFAGVIRSSPFSPR